MLKNKIIVKKIRNIFILLMAIIIMLGTYRNIRNSRAENVIQVELEVADKSDILSAQTMIVDATETSDGNYLVNLPISVNKNMVTKYYTSSGEEIEVNVENNIATVQLTDEEVKNKKVQLQTDYDTKEVTDTKSGEKKLLYKRLLTNEPVTEEQDETSKSNEATQSNSITKNETTTQKETEKQSENKNTTQGSQNTDNTENAENQDVIATGYMPIDAKMEVKEIDLATLTSVKIPNEKQTMQKAYEVSIYQMVEKKSEETKSEENNSANANSDEANAGKAQTNSDATNENQTQKTSDVTNTNEAQTSSDSTLNSETEGTNTTTDVNTETNTNSAVDSEKQNVEMERVEYDPSIYEEKVTIITKNEQVNVITTIYALEKDNKVAKVESTTDNTKNETRFETEKTGETVKYVIATEEIPADVDNTTDNDTITSDDKINNSDDVTTTDNNITNVGASSSTTSAPTWRVENINKDKTNKRVTADLVVASANFTSVNDSTLTTDDITVAVDGEVNKIITKNLGTPTFSTNASTGLKEIKYTLTLGNWEEATRQAGKSFKEYSGDVKVTIKGNDNGPYIPTGFSHVNGTSLDNGYTVQDGNGNQYVWVEVPKTAEVYPTAGLGITSFSTAEYTKIENDLNTYTSAYKESEYTDEWSSQKATGLTSSQYTELKQKMLKSIYKNGGFYVGKYETGIENTFRKNDSAIPTETPVIKQNAYPYNNVTCSQAQTLASQMATQGNTTSLMFGVQWNLVLKYLEIKGTTQSELNSNSTSWGNYNVSSYNITNASSKYSEQYGAYWTNGAYGVKSRGDNILLSTGASNVFNKQGIYDLAGNVQEWTLEYATSDSSSSCVARGSAFGAKVYTVSASTRTASGTTSRTPYDGFRTVLYKTDESSTGSSQKQVLDLGQVDFINPEYTYKYANTTIDHDKKTVTVVFDVTDKYFSTSALTTDSTASNITVNFEGKEATNATKELSKLSDITETINGTAKKVGEKYQLVVSNLDQGNGGDYSGIMTLIFPEGVVTDISNNKSVAKTITIGVDDPIDTGSTEGPYLPTGFTHVEGTSLDNGYTVQDSKGNQFVWVEVPKTADVYPTAGLDITEFTTDEYTKIENDLHTYTSVYREDGYTDEWGAQNATGLTSDQYTELKQKMLRSVYKNGGFYIGKYETGIESTYRTANTTPTETPVIKQNAYPYTWVTSSQAQALASKFASNLDGYTSSLLFGVQWDLTLKYLETKGATQAELNEDSTNWGNYYYNLWNITNTNSKYSADDGITWTNGTYGQKSSREGILLSTGASDTFSKQGIYDLAGNVFEWTLEAYSAAYRAYCGGVYSTTDRWAASDRHVYFYLTGTYTYVGSRLALYKDVALATDSDAPGTGSKPVIVDVVDPVWKVENINVNSTNKKLTVDLIATDKYLTGVENSTLTTDDITLTVDGDANANNVITKTLSEPTFSTNSSTGLKEIKYTLTLENWEESARQAGKSFLEYSGSAKIIIKAGTVTDSAGGANNKPSGLFDEEGVNADKLHIGDFIEYDAGTWTSQEFRAIQTGLKPNLQRVTSYLPTKAYQFGGFTPGSSRNGSAQVASVDGHRGEYVKDASTNSPVTGWRLFDLDGDTMTLISAGNPEDYFHAYDSTNNVFASEYILTGNVDTQWNNTEESAASTYKKRDWSVYVNSNQKAVSAMPVTRKKLQDWYIKYTKNGGDANHNRSYPKLYSEPYLRYQNIIDNYSVYWEIGGNNSVDNNRLMYIMRTK